MSKWVVNTSPLIALSRIGRIDLLESVIPDYAIPMGVVAEINAGPQGDPAIAWIHHVDRSRIVTIVSIDPIVAAWDLGKGESEALSWAYEHEGWGAVLDDATARKCARAIGVAVGGTVGLLGLAKRRGLLDSIDLALGELLRIGFYISPSLVGEARRVAGE